MFRKEVAMARLLTYHKFEQSTETEVKKSTSKIEKIMQIIIIIITIIIIIIFIF